MEKEATISSLFGETIYYTNIVNNDQDTESMLNPLLKKNLVEQQQRLMSKVTPCLQI